MSSKPRGMAGEGMLMGWLRLAPGHGDVVHSAGLRAVPCRLLGWGGGWLKGAG